MSWKRNHAHALAPPSATSKPAGRARKQPNNLVGKPRFNAAVYAPGVVDVNDGASVWRTHDPTTDPFVSMTRDHTSKSVSSTSSSPMHGSASNRKSGAGAVSTRSTGTQTTTSCWEQPGPDVWRDLVKDVHAMPAATVDRLLEVLLERKHTLKQLSTSGPPPPAPPAFNAVHSRPVHVSPHRNDSYEVPCFKHIIPERPCTRCISQLFRPCHDSNNLCSRRPNHCLHRSLPFRRHP
ncbi:hypothetical protein, variant [Aphanomyces invadans]|uniref:Uncharacterized protein n=1 Tax=Aphanomyces invadans TaxID=157072 RepID=A0A024TTK2_9STRA|nr:hypothetical protein, variant [Aphanomyces invadans]ETV96657.1 hypothetical protein, variant [Aphanomyces invadans]|eukprot:XP_008874920.1 hypothetical protein, variant [Aphanomyces invadans]